MKITSKIKISFITLVFAGICVLNMSLFFNENNSDLSLRQMLKFSNAQASEINPNAHYGYKRNYSKNCCESSENHDDECTGTFC